MRRLNKPVSRLYTHPPPPTCIKVKATNDGERVINGGKSIKTRGAREPAERRKKPLTRGETRSLNLRTPLIHVYPV